MRQRAMIAMALACDPAIVIGDEPTTALDVMVQAQILQLLEQLRHELGLSLILITHDLSVIAETCDRVMIMYAGRVAEEGPVARGLRRAAPPVHAEAALGVPEHPRRPADPRRHPRARRRTCATRRPAAGSQPRCPLAMDVCRRGRPARGALRDGVRVACHLYPTAATPSSRRRWSRRGPTPPPGARPRRRQPAGGRRVTRKPTGSPARRRAPTPGEPSGGRRTRGHDRSMHRPRARPASSSPGRPLVRLEGLEVHFPIRRRARSTRSPRRPRGVVRAVDGIDLTIRAGRGPRARRRVGSGKTTTGRVIVKLTRQTGGTIVVRGRGRHRRCGARAAARPTGGGSSSSSRTRTRRSTRSRPSTTSWPSRSSVNGIGTEARARARGPRRARGRRPAPGRRLRLPLPARAVGRPAPARRHRRGAGHGPGPHRRRRAGLDARRLDPDRAAAPDARPAQGARADLPVHHPRPVAGLGHRRPDRGHVPRQDHGDRAGGARSSARRATRTRRRSCRCRRRPTRRPRASAPTRTILVGETPDAAHIPTGCRFHPRCPLAFDRCRVEEPPLFDVGDGQPAACWLAQAGPLDLPVIEPSTAARAAAAEVGRPGRRLGARPAKRDRRQAASASVHASSRATSRRTAQRGQSMARPPRSNGDAAVAERAVGEQHGVGLRGGCGGVTTGVAITSASSAAVRVT